MDLKVKHKPINTLEENIGGNCQDLGLGKDTKSTIHKSKQ